MQQSTDSDREVVTSASRQVTESHRDPQTGRYYWRCLLCPAHAWQPEPSLADQARALHGHLAEHRAAGDL